MSPKSEGGIPLSSHSPAKQAPMAGNPYIGAGWADTSLKLKLPAQCVAVRRSCAQESAAGQTFGHNAAITSLEAPEFQQHAIFI